jgi:hypothetical protein
MWFISDWGMGARYEFSLGNEIQTYNLVGDDAQACPK